MIYIIIFIVSVLTAIMIKSVAIHDHPNERSAHTVAVPTGGGLSFIVAFYVGLIYFFLIGQVSADLFYALLCGLLLVLVSFVDDMVELSPKLRLLTQLVTVVSAFYFLGIFTAFAWYVVIFFTLAALWLINLYNFLDGIDGYAGSEGVVVSLGAFALYHDSLFVMMAVAIGGFLIFNWQRASLFMGDVGSTFLGFFFVVMALYHYHDSQDIMIWVILLYLFIFDASLTLIRRFMRGEKLSQAHKKHLFQRLVQSGYSHQKTVLLAMGINLAIMIALYAVDSGVGLLILFVGYTLFLVWIAKEIEKKRAFDV